MDLLGGRGTGNNFWKEGCDGGDSSDFGSESQHPGSQVQDISINLPQNLTGYVSGAVLTKRQVPSPA